MNTRSKVKAQTSNLFQQAKTKVKQKGLDKGRLNNIKHWKASQIPVKQDGYNLIQAKFKDADGFANEEIEAVASRYQEHYVDNLEAKGIDTDKFRFEMLVSQFYDESIFWQSGKWREFGTTPDFYDYSNQYEFDGEALQSTFPRFNLIIKQVLK